MCVLWELFELALLVGVVLWLVRQAKKATGRQVRYRCLLYTSPSPRDRS